MKILVACEESQTVCKAFRERGHEAYSCDIQVCSGGHPEWHIKGDVRPLLLPNRTWDSRHGIQFQTMDGKTHDVQYWDLIIAHPPCTMISKVSSVALKQGKHSIDDVYEGAEFFMDFYELNGKVCIENPVPMKLAGLPKHSQTIQPYEFGDNWTKLTCLWLKGLPPLIPQCYAIMGEKRNVAPSWVYHKHGRKLRSKTFPGIAKAMAQQWG